MVCSYVLGVSFRVSFLELKIGDNVVVVVGEVLNRKGEVDLVRGFGLELHQVLCYLLEHVLCMEKVSFWSFVKTFKG